MGELQQLRTSTERTIDELQKERAERAAAVAEAALQQHDVPSGEPFEQLLRKESEFADRLRNLVSRKEQAQAILGRVSELEEQKKELDGEHKALMRNLEPLFRPIGENAFRVYRENPLVDQEYAEVFAPLVEQYELIKSSEREVGRLEKEEESKPFLERVVIRGRLALARNRLTSRKAQLERLFGKAGRQIVNTEFVTSIGDPSLDEVTSPFLDRIETRQRVEHDLQIVEDELTTLSKEYAELCEGYRAKGCVAELDEAISSEMDQRQQVLAKIGSAMAASESASLSGEAGTQLEALRVIEKQVGEKQAFLERVRAAIEVERLDAELDANQKSIERKQSQIKELEISIEDLKKTKSKLEAEKSEQERLQGERSELNALEATQ
ncbi:MAG: hypothetical protein ACLFP4_11680 [Spirochaetales bacterium]